MAVFELKNITLATGKKLKMSRGIKTISVYIICIYLKEYCIFV